MADQQDNNSGGKVVPGPPVSFLTSWGQSLLSKAQFSEYEATIKQEEEERERSISQLKQMQQAVQFAKHNLDSGNHDAFATHFERATKVAEEIAADTKAKMEKTGATTPHREGRLIEAMESYGRVCAYKHFLAEGVVVARAQLAALSDDEYLGAVILMVQDLGRYAIGRATKRDVASITLTRDITEAVLAELMKFDFRNGHLRRIYDSVKYGFRRIENILYQLSHAEPDKPAPAEQRQQGLLVVEDFEAIRKRMEAADEKRERVIKRCRDAQKASKQAIFSLHRKDSERANKQLGVAAAVLKELLPLITESPSLRGGSFSGAVEEYAEAKLFQEWLDHRRLLSMSDLEFANGDEYIGGLCDLTGELGRFAVARATQRDQHTVEQCLDTDLAIQAALLDLGTPFKLAKKMDTLRVSVSKLEGLLYELCLLDQSKAPPHFELPAPDNDGDGDGDNKDE